MFLAGMPFVSTLIGASMSMLAMGGAVPQSTLAYTVPQHDYNLIAESGGGGSGCEPGVSATTDGAGGISSSGAVLFGSINGSCGGGKNGIFYYSTLAVCAGGSSVRVPSAGYIQPGGTVVTGNDISAVVSGLLPNTTYYYCASNYSTASLQAYGAILAFTTLGVPPGATTGAESAVTSSSATLNGTVDPNGAATTAYYRYSTSNTGSCATLTSITSGSSAGSGQSSVSKPIGITGLLPNTVYYYCIRATSAFGTTYGSIQALATLAVVPTVVTGAESALTISSATLNGTVDANGAATNAWFRYSTTNPGSCNNSFGSATTVTAKGSAQSAVAHSASITGLLPNTTYYYCIVASNTAGYSYGAMGSLVTTAGPPVLVTNSETGVTSSGATLNGTADPNGSATSAWYRYSTTNPGSCNNTFGSATGVTAAGSGQSPVAYTATLSGLPANTTYYYCAVGSNTAGTGYGVLSSLTTLAVAPTVVTGNETGVTYSGATLNGTADPNGAATNAWFRYSTTNPGSCNNTFGTATGIDAVGSGQSAVAYNAVITGLSANTTYYYCAVGSNAAGTAYGAVTSLTTGSIPTECSDGIDNDADGKVDLVDPDCTNSSDDTEAPLYVSMTFTAGASRVRIGDTTTLTWNTGNRTHCVITGSNGNNFGSALSPLVLTGTQTTAAITQVARYRLSCTDDNASKEVTIQVIPVVQEI